jgi:hypothetical protein
MELPALPTAAAGQRQWGWRPRGEAGGDAADPR